LSQCDCVTLGKQGESAQAMGRCNIKQYRRLAACGQQPLRNMRGCSSRAARRFLGLDKHKSTQDKTALLLCPYARYARSWVVWPIDANIQPVCKQTGAQKASAHTAHYKKQRTNNTNVHVIIVCLEALPGSHEPLTSMQFHQGTAVPNTVWQRS